MDVLSDSSVVILPDEHVVELLNELERKNSPKRARRLSKSPREFNQDCLAEEMAESIPLSRFIERKIQKRPDRKKKKHHRKRRAASRLMLSILSDNAVLRKNISRLERTVDDLSSWKAKKEIEEFKVAERKRLENEKESDYSRILELLGVEGSLKE